MIRAFFSNRVENLYYFLKTHLFSAPTTPFTKRIVIVPSPAMKNWVMAALADDPDIGIAAGVHLTYLEPAIQELIKSLSCDPSAFPSRTSEMGLAIRIETEIRKVIKCVSHMGEEEKKRWTLLFEFIRLSSGSYLRKREERRILMLSYQLANLFITYGNYGKKMLQEWQALPDHRRGWQEELWFRCVNATFPDQMEWKEQNCVVHVFAQSFISEQHHRLLESLSKRIPVYTYVLSPCKMFWSELLSDQECRKLVRFWEKQGVKEAEQQALEEYIYDRNPLLANLGRVGREMALELEKSEIQSDDSYVIPKGCYLNDLYREWISEECEVSETDISLLNALQTDLLVMRTPAVEEKIDLLEDRSIQVLVSSSLMREVQTLYDVLVGIIQKHKNDQNPILPEDIVVMAPDIIAYEPFIRSVFSQEGSKLDYQLMDLNLLSHHWSIQGFMGLISLALSRWDVTSVMQLFESPSFQKKQGITAEELALIKRWIDLGDVRWGEDPEHRKEILSCEYEEESEIDPSPSGTWQSAIERLLLGMVMIKSQDNSEGLDLIPINGIETTTAVFFGKWIRLFRSLREDLKPLMNGTRFTLNQWSFYLKCLYESYFECSQSDETQALYEIIDRIGSEANEELTFQTVHFHLTKALEKERLCYRESHLHAVKFCSMLPMRALPAKVVVLLGMSEENYPRKDNDDSLNMLKRHSGSDYAPTQSSFDRYLFLETILSSRQYYLISYCGYSKMDGKDQPPSLLVSELFNYLDHSYTINGKVPSQVCFRRFPFSAYDHRLFGMKSEIQSYSDLYYEAAKAFYRLKDKTSSHSFIQAFDKKSVSDVPQEDFIDIKLIAQIAKNPIEAYLKSHLGIYLDRIKEKEKINEEDFVLSAMDHALFKKSSLKASLEPFIQLFEKEGRFPLGPFKEYSIDKLRFEIEMMKKHLLSSGICEGAIFEIECSDYYQQPEKGKTGIWHVPPLECSYKVIGELNEISESGMVVYADDNKRETLKVWPLFLVYLCLVDRYELPFEKKIIFAKSGKIREPFFNDPFPYLESYLHYLMYAKRNISPLIPEWVPEIMEGNLRGLEEKISDTLSPNNPYFYNDYLKWIVRGSQLPDHELILDHWKHTAQELFGELFEAWYSKRKKVKVGE